MNSFDFDSIVVGSGFGGAVSACRMAEHGMRVAVLERGRRWTPETYPRSLTNVRDWIWSQSAPHTLNGWIDLRTFRSMWVATGAGVGGGSLIYANISVPPEARSFASGWPPSIVFQELLPYVDRVGRMLNVQYLPDNQLNPRFRLMREAAQQAGWGERFRKLPLAVNFDPDLVLDPLSINDERKSQRRPNAFGREQGTCIHCGNCDIGCQVQARNTLDLNYLAVAEDHGAEVRPLHVVRSLEPVGTGWKVVYDELTADGCRRGSITAQRVVLGAGSIGSTELLLRCRDETKTLPQLSKKLGCGWAFNGDFVTPAHYPSREILPSCGPTISCAIDLLDGAFKGQALFIEDGGIPNLAVDFFLKEARKRGWGLLRRMWRDLARVATRHEPFERMMPWFGQGVDAGDGRLYLGRKWYAPWRRTLEMDWRYEGSAALVDAMVEAHRKLSRCTEGEPFVPPTWTDWHHLITPHPLGGCNMGLSIDDGVVDAEGRVFGYDNLFVMDGASIPRPLGLNPSRTIAALAERNIERLCRAA